VCVDVVLKKACAVQKCGTDPCSSASGHERTQKQYKFSVRVMVFYETFNNISVIS